MEGSCIVQIFFWPKNINTIFYSFYEITSDFSLITVANSLISIENIFLFLTIIVSSCYIFDWCIYSLLWFHIIYLLNACHITISILTLDFLTTKVYLQTSKIMAILNSCSLGVFFYTHRLQHTESRITL